MRTKRPYAIAQYLTLEAKRAAIAKVYSYSHTHRCRRTDRDYCPLGVAFSVMLPDVTPSIAHAPGYYEIESLLGTIPAGQALQFTDAWDNGDIQIRDLPIALGVYDE